MKKMKKLFAAALFLGSLCLFLPMQLSGIQVSAKRLPVSVSGDTVKVGKTLQITSKIKDVYCSSSDTSVATVSETGRITGKKEGKAIIRVKKKGYDAVKFPVTVTKNGRYPSIPVTLDETVTALAGHSAFITAKVTNHSKTGAIRKIVYEYQAVIWHKTEAEDMSVQDGADDGQKQPETDAGWEKEKKTVKVRISGIAAGKSKKVRVDGDFGDAKKLTLTLKSVKLYTGKLLLSYNIPKDKMSMQWGVKDKKAPVITGWTGKDSYNAKDVYMVVYPDKKYDLAKYVKATDDRDGKVAVQVDDSRINWKKKGVYTIVFTASDQAGNKARAKAKVQVRTVSDLDQMADSILSGIVKDSWTDQKKAEAIYRYVRQNYVYVDSNDHANWENSALYGLRYKSGNCFVFYSVSRLLLTRCGIPNIEVKRSAGSTHGHWWNYVYVKGGWYHFDTTPRRIKATFCLVTDSQLTAYSNAAGNSHIWDKTIIPKGAVKEISAIGWGRNY